MKKGRVKEELKRKERQDAVEKHKRKSKKKKNQRWRKINLLQDRTNARSLQGFVPVQVSPVSVCHCLSPTGPLCWKSRYLFLFAHGHDCSEPCGCDLCVYVCSCSVMSAPLQRLVCEEVNSKCFVPVCLTLEYTEPLQRQHLCSGQATSVFSLLLLFHHILLATSLQETLLLPSFLLSSLPSCCSCLELYHFSDSFLFQSIC